MALYTKGSGKHEYATSLPAIGRPSYISVKLFAKFPFQSNHFSDLTCEELHTVTNLHLTPTDMLISLSRFDSQIHRSQFKLPSSDPNSVQALTLINIPPEVVQLLHKLQAAANELYDAAAEIRKELKKKNVEIAPSPED